MTIDRNKFYLLTICCCFSLCGTTAHALSLQQQHQQQHQQQSIKDDAKHQQDAAGAFESARNFHPRMDYNNEWRPVGRGDPLQNDPTYDYSPPALERVRYWAADKDVDKDGNNEGDTASSGSKTTAASSKNEILLLGVTNERIRPAMPHALKNAKGELPLLQPKYSSIRRSYYAHQLPTHLMPPPMQSSTGTAASGMHNMMKPSANVVVDYRHSMPSPSFTNAGASSSSSMAGAVNMKHTKPYYSTAATSPWTHMHSTAHSQSSITPSTATTITMQHVAHGMPYGAYDSHPQESAHYVSYTRPGMSHAAETYSPNAIRPSSHGTKTGSGASGRKPWLHELLQKELIKPVRPTMPATKYLMGPATKPSYEVVSSQSIALSTTYKPVNFVTTSTTYMPPRQTTLPPISYTSSPVYVTSTSRPTTTTTSTTTTTPSPFYQSATRLLIPETSNLAFRPTVAPMEMTTDSLFSHYNQPEKPLMGPMYLIIEGHSKVKTYGKDELDPHRPKIVPVIPKREPIVRIADPNEQRGSVATFQVKHLHTVTTPATTTTTITTTTTRKPTTTKPVTKATATTAKTTTTTKATTLTTSLRPTMRTTTTTTTSRPTAKTTTRQATTTTAKATTPTHRATAMPLKLTTSNTSKTPNRTSSSESTILTNIQNIPTQPPTGMQGLLSLLDASFGSFFENEPTGMDAELTKQQQQQQQRPQLQNLQLEPRIGIKGDSISAYREDFVGTTELAPREVRNTYDYEQLSDARLKQLLGTNYGDEDEDDEIEEYEDSMDDSIKRFDRVMDYAEEDKMEMDNKGFDNEGAEDVEQAEDDEDQDDVEKNVRVA